MLIQSSYERASGPIAMGLLDFCNVGIDGSAERGLGDTIETAILAERLGYKRYWLAEHWGADVSTPSPELLTPIIAGMTERIRVGPAGVLLPFYSPLEGRQQRAFGGTPISRSHRSRARPRRRCSAGGQSIGGTC